MFGDRTHSCRFRTVGVVRVIARYLSLSGGETYQPNRPGEMRERQSLLPVIGNDAGEPIGGCPLQALLHPH